MESLLSLNTVLSVLLGLCVIQIVFVIKMSTLLRNMRKHLFDMRLLSRHNEATELRRRSITDYKSCQFCRHRLSYIQITEQAASDDFYYKCQKRDVEVILSDTCTMFERDLLLK